MYGVIETVVTRGSGGLPWCARLIGMCLQYGFRREFINGVRDYTYAGEHRGVRLYFAVPPGIYEVYDAHARGRRYFILVDDQGDIAEISREEVLACLKNTTSE